MSEPVPNPGSAVSDQLVLLGRLLDFIDLLQREGYDTQPAVTWCNRLFLNLLKALGPETKWEP